LLRMRTLLMLCVALTIPWAYGADVGLSPHRLELRAPAGGIAAGSVTVLTTSASRQPIAVDTSDWLMDLAGRLAYLPPGTIVHSAASWIDTDTQGFVLEPADDHVVRITVNVPDDAEGTHHAMVMFSIDPSVSGSDGVGVTTTTRIALTVYVTVAGTERSGSELVDMYQSDDRTLNAVILNTGNTVMRLGGVVEIRDEAGDVVRRLHVPDVPVLRESEREIRFALPDDLEPGFYVALALIEDSRGGVLAGELPFDVP
jgi:hypothetical protein